MKFRINPILFACPVLFCACQSKPGKSHDSQNTSFKKGTFAYDLNFLKDKDSVVVLKDNTGRSQVIVSAKYQGKVFTSTADGDTGKSFGWINYKAFSGPVDPHMNGYGGEDRLWLGPEGGKFALFFKQGDKMEFANWHTPAAFDHESWTIASKDDKQVSLTKSMRLSNYKGTQLDIKVARSITLLRQADIEKALNIQLDKSVQSVG